MSKISPIEKLVRRGKWPAAQPQVARQNASGSRAGVAAEHAWLHATYPGYRLRKQPLGAREARGGHTFAHRCGGKDLTVYFDISDFFGKEIDR
jgi:hypothetical protein